MGGDCGFRTVTSHPWDSPGVLFQQLTKTSMLTATPPACSPVPAPAPRAERAWALDSGQTLPSDPMAKPGLRVSGGQGQEKSGPSQALGDSGEGPLPWSCRAGVTWGWTAPRGREWGPHMARPGSSSWDPGATGVEQCGVKPGGHRQPPHVRCFKVLGVGQTLGPRTGYRQPDRNRP